MKTCHIPIFVPHRGCPNDCVFCNQRSITGCLADTTAEDVKRIIEEHLATIDDGCRVQAAFFGGSFTGIEIENQIALMQAAFPYVEDGRISGLRCSTRPDYINDEILTALSRYSMECIELGVQSTDCEVLKLSNRGHTFEDVKKAAALIKKYNIELGVQMMLGLPGDTREKMIKTASDLISLEPSCVRIYPTLVVENTRLHDMYESGEYVPLGIEETVDILSVIIPMFKKHNITIIRVGLQTTDDINVNTVKGPYHPAIRELAEGRIIRNIIEGEIENMPQTTEILCNPSRVSQIAGHKGANKEYFAQKYSKRLRIISDKTMETDKLKICDKIVAIY